MKIDEIKKGFQEKDRGALAKAITLIESSKAQEHQLAFSLIEHDSQKTSKVIGVSGPPGVGKSTFLNAITKTLLKENDKIQIAILAVDPSSDLSGGSILGDKTRMGEISSLEQVFIRPTAAGSFLGGTATRTFETIKLCEAFGFDYIFVETVGVGQSESMIAHMVDYFILLANPSAGDDLQGMKRGVLEFVDLLLINKCDGELEKIAKIALNFFDSSQKYEVRVISSLEKKNIEDVTKSIKDFFSSYDSLKRLAQFDIFTSKYFDNYIQEQVNNFKKTQGFNGVGSVSLKDLQKITEQRWQSFKK